MIIEMTDVFYYSSKSKPCEVILQKLERMPQIRSKFQYVSIDTSKPQHHIRTVPAIVINRQILEGKQVFDWLEKESYDTPLPPFEVGFGTNNFSSIEDPNAPADRNHNFTYIEENPSHQQPQQQQKQNGGIQGSKPQKIGDSALDDLINQRKMEIPIQRGRS